MVAGLGRSKERRGARQQRVRFRRSLAAVVLTIGGVLIVVPMGSSSAEVAAVTGSAFGASGEVTIVFFQGHIVLAPTPSVTLPATGGSQSDSAAEARLATGPAVILTTGALSVETQGTTGAAGSVTSSATAADVGPGPITADSMISTCTASETAIAGSTEIVNGQVVTSEGDPDVEGDETTVDVPVDPPPNTEISGVIESVGDNFRVVFNEQVVTANSITVNAMHLYLIGPNALGDAFVGQTVCGVSDVAPTTTTSSTTTTIPPTTTTSSTTTSTLPPTTTTSSTTTTRPSTTTNSTTTTTQPSGTTTTTTQPSGTTTTTQPPGTTTTTQPPGTTTTTQPTGTTTTTRPISTTTTTTTTTTPIGPGIDCATVAPTGTTRTATVDPNAAVAGSNASVTGGGFTPGELLEVDLCSSPVHLADVTADASGGFQATVTIPAGTPAGAHTIVVSSADRSRIALASITVVAQGGGSTPGGAARGGSGGILARTGAEATRLGGLAALALIVGVALVRSARRARRWPYRTW